LKRGDELDRFTTEASNGTNVKSSRLAPLDYFFRALAIASVLEIGAVATNIVTHPDAPGILHQGLAPRIVLGMFAGPSMILFAALLLWRTPSNHVGRFLLLLGLTEVGAQFDFGSGPPFVSALAFDLFLLFAGGIGAPSVGYLMFSFPTGTLYPSHWTRGVKIAAVLKFVGVVLELVASPTRISIFRMPLNPLFVPALAPFQPLVAPTIGVTGVLLPLISMMGIVSLGLRYRSAETRVRQQIKWVIWSPGIGIFCALVGLALMFSGVTRSLLVPLVFFTLAQLTLLASLTIAILRYHLFDIDRLINHTLVYSILTIVVIALYVLAVGSLGILFQTSGNVLVSLLATGLVAILFEPVRERLQRSVNRLMYGERDEPYTVLSRLGQRLEATLAPDEVLPTIVETVAQALKLPYAAIALHDERQPTRVSSSVIRPSTFVVASYGEPGREMVEISLSYQGETIGQLVLAPRSPGEPFTSADRRLLEQFARQAGIAAYGVRLTRELQRSRERLVMAREEERRRIRRDLHDGLGPALAAQTLKVGAARARLAQNPEAVDQLLAELERDIQAALADIRRLVYDLRPPALDELGLASAIREAAAQYTTPRVADPRLCISVDAPERMPPLSAAVEVAAWRIVQEALTNVVRHSGARNCLVRLTLDDQLRMEISDDGRGLDGARRAGVGLTSMRERAVELGGTCVIETRREGGTRVFVQLPLEGEA
jgi:signal transduction histidine kinase